MESEGNRTQNGWHRSVVTLVLVGSMLMSSGCQTVVHTVGAGATGGEYHEMTQWYGLWGLWPIGGAPDARTLAGDRTNYTMVASFDTGDSLLNLLTFPFSFYRRTIAVNY